MKEDTSLITTFRLTGIFSIPVFLSVFWLELYDSLTFRVLFAFNSQTEWPQWTSQRTRSVRGHVCSGQKRQNQLGRGNGTMEKEGMRNKKRSCLWEKHLNPQGKLVTIPQILTLSPYQIYCKWQALTSWRGRMPRSMFRHECSDGVRCWSNRQTSVGVVHPPSFCLVSVCACMNV